MKVCVTAQGNTLDSPVDPRFGRCSYFIFVDPDSMSFEAIANPAAMAGGGAGIQAAQLVAEQGAQVVLTGNMGPNAYRALSAAGVTVYAGVAGTVRSAVEHYRSGSLQAATAPTGPAHAGMGWGMGRGRGRGMGRGRGRW